MGYGYCPKCGSDQGVAVACRHVISAVAGGVPNWGAEFREYADEDSGRMIWAATFCPGCIASLQLPPVGSRLSIDQVADALATADGVCGGCLRRWLNLAPGTG